MSEQHEKMLERVRALLAKAAGGTTEQEAELLRAKADELMTKYAIEMWQIEAAQENATGRTKPEIRHMNIDWWWSMDDDLGGALWSVFVSVCSHARCRIAYKNVSGRDKTVPVVGMPADLGYVDMLFTHLFLQMVETMDPHPKPGEGTIEAIVRMKESGLKWEEIYYRLRKAGHYPENQPWSPSKMDYAGKYTRYCLEHGRERVRTTPSVYRRSFASGFSSALSSRLRQQREEQGQSTGSMAIAIRDISALVQDALYEFFPNQAVQSRSRAVARADRKIDLASMARGSQAGHEASIISNSPKIGSKRELGH